RREAQAERERITDVGEKLAGSRKDREALRAQMARDFTDDELASLPLSQIWPASEIDKIEDPYTAAFAYAARDSIPSKPRTPYKVRSWVEKVKAVRGLVRNIIDGVPRETIESSMRAMPALNDLRSRIVMLENIDRENWKRIGDVHERPDAYRIDGGKRVDSPYVAVRIDGDLEIYRDAQSVAD